MAIALMGNDPSLRASVNSATFTRIAKIVTAPIRGILKSYSIYWGAAGTGIKIKIFRDDGTNYLFIGETPAVALATGLFALPAWISVEKGDYIAVYWATGTLYTTDDTTDNGHWYKAGDVTSDSLKTGWTSVKGTMSIQGNIFTRVAPFIL